MSKSTMEKALENTLKVDLANGNNKESAKAFHKHVTQAIIDGMDDDDIRQAIRNNWDTIRPKALADGMPEEVTVEEFIENEISMDQFRALFQPLGDQDDDV